MQLKFISLGFIAAIFATNVNASSGSGISDNSGGNHRNIERSITGKLFGPPVKVKKHKTAGRNSVKYGDPVSVGAALNQIGSAVAKLSPSASCALKIKANEKKKFDPSASTKVEFSIRRRALTQRSEKTAEKENKGEEEQDYVKQEFIIAAGDDGSADSGVEAFEGVEGVDPMAVN